jgi:5'-nucleotidase
MTKIAMFDMDGTLCDFHTAFHRDMAALRAPGEETYSDYHNPANLPAHINRRVELVMGQTGWWLSLKPLEDGLTIYRLALEIGFKPQILTKGSRTAANCWTEKYLWIRNNIDPMFHQGERVVDVTITQNKSNHYGRVLVEDYPPFVEGWLKHRPRGLVVLMDRDYNREFQHPQVVRYTGNNLEEVRERLVAQYER